MPLEGPVLVCQPGLRRGDGAVVAGADLHLDDGPRCGAGCSEHVLAAHHDLDRATRLRRQQRRYRFDVDRGLAAEAAADLRGDHLDARGVPAQHRGRRRPHHEVALRGGPDDRFAFLVAVDHAGVRLDVALVHRLGRELTLDHDVGFGEPLLDVTALVHRAGRDVRRLGGPRLDAAGEQVVVQHRCVIGHRVGDVQHVGQQLVGDLDGLRCRLGLSTGGRRYRSHGVAAVQHRVAGDDRAHQVARRALGRCFGEVGPGDHRFHAGHRLGG